jgi:hypothetical protein
MRGGAIVELALFKREVVGTVGEELIDNAATRLDELLEVSLNFADDGIEVADEQGIAIGLDDEGVAGLEVDILAGGGGNDDPAIVTHTDMFSFHGGISKLSTSRACHDAWSLSTYFEPYGEIESAFNTRPGVQQFHAAQRRGFYLSCDGDSGFHRAGAEHDR